MQCKVLHSLQSYAVSRPPPQKTVALSKGDKKADMSLLYQYNGRKHFLCKGALSCYFLTTKTQESILHNRAPLRLVGISTLVLKWESLNDRIECSLVYL